MKTKFSSKQCPQSAAVILAFREAFGESARVLWLDENGVQHGQDERQRDRQFRELASIIPSAVQPTKEPQ